MNGIHRPKVVNNPVLIHGFATDKNRRFCLTFTNSPKRQHSEKLSKCHTVTFCNIWNGILTVWPEVNFKSSTKYIFGYLISVKHYGESLNTTSRNQFLTWCCQTIDVTQWQSWIWKTVQNHNSGCNFFIWKRIWNLQYALDSVWYWGWF